MKKYLVSHRLAAPGPIPDWNSDVWNDVPSVSIDNFHPQSSDHRPISAAKICFTTDRLHVIFRVKDRYIKSVATEHQQMVCHDSCVEFFVQPGPDKGYFNFEFNCGGIMLLYYVTDPTRTPAGLKRQTQVTVDDLATIQIATTMPRINPIEITEPTEWFLQASIPFDLFRAYAGDITTAPGHRWRANLYKCGDKTSHPHWASWSPIGDQLNFHQPDKFGELEFEPAHKLANASVAR
jgi:hypothetical protein